MENQCLKIEGNNYNFNNNTEFFKGNINNYGNYNYGSQNSHRNEEPSQNLNQNFYNNKNNNPFDLNSKELAVSKQCFLNNNSNHNQNILEHEKEV